MSDIMVCPECGTDDITEQEYLNMATMAVTPSGVYWCNGCSEEIEDPITSEEFDIREAQRLKARWED